MSILFCRHGNTEAVFYSVHPWLNKPPGYGCHNSGVKLSLLCR